MLGDIHSFSECKTIILFSKIISCFLRYLQDICQYIWQIDIITRQLWFIDYITMSPPRQLLPNSLSNQLFSLAEIGLLLILVPLSIYRTIPAGIWCQNDVVSTSMRRNHVASTLLRRHFRTKCPLGCLIRDGIVTISLTT